VQVDDPFVRGQSFFGAVISEQAARAIEAITVETMRSLRRIIGVSPDKGLEAVRT
jgi:hypothetical protein